MEKFAVDLEKVLDEFEYNEEREENVTAPSIRNQPLPGIAIGTLRQAPAVRPPAASYRRPSFEPINLADADFAASPPKQSSINFSLGPSLTGKQNEDETFSFVGNKAQLTNRNFVNSDNNLVSALNNDANIKNLLISESSDETPKVWPKPHSSMTNDEKPDLLEYNSKNVDFDTNSLEIHNQLPDITTSVRSLDHDTNCNEEDSVPSSLDLISSTNGHLAPGNGEPVQRSCYYESDKSHIDEPEVNISEIIKVSDSGNNVGITLECPNQEENSALNGSGSQDISQGYPSIPLNLGNVEIINNVCGKGELNDNIDLYTNVQNQVPETPKDATFASAEENIKPEELSYGGCESQMDLAETVQPIGFTNDSDVSESELEEYLKELEEMDEKVDSKEENLTEKLLKQEQLSIHEKVEENKILKTTYENKKLNNVTTNISSSNEFVNESKEDENKIKNVHSDVFAAEDFNKKNQILENNESTSVNFESSSFQTDNLNTSSSSAPQNGFISASSDQIQNQEMNTNDAESRMLEDRMLVDKSQSISVSDTSAKNHSEQNHSNSFCSTNPFESVDTTINDGTKDIESTNPFDEEDCGYVSEKTEVKRTSTNPFEEDEDVTINDSVPETSVPAKLRPPLENLTLTDKKPHRKNSKKDKAKPAIVRSEDMPSLPSPHSNNRNLSNQSVEELEAPVSKKSSKSTVDASVSESAIQENAANESLPSCSSSSSCEESFSKILETSAKMIPIKAAVESPSGENVDEAGVPAEEDRPLRPNSLELPKKITVEPSAPISPPAPQSPPQSPITGQLAREFGPEDRRLGKIPPFWVPDTDANSCMQCQQKFTVIKRRHHCRACGQVLCNKCCGLRARLEYMNFAEARVCQPCFTILEALNESGAASPLGRQPNPNNPMEYCSTIPPLQQAAGSLHQPPPSVMVPVGVLKREGRMKSEVTKQVMFSDGIRPGGDLTELDGSCEPRMPFRRPGRLTKRVGTPPGGVMSSSMRRVLDPTTHSFIPSEGESSLPPVVTRSQGEVTFNDHESPITLDSHSIKFALNRNLFVVVKRVMLDCCVNRECWCFSTEGLACVGQDEIVFLLECLPQETLPPKDIFLLINHLYQEAAKGLTVSEMSFTPATSNNLLGSKDHGGFLYIRTSYQCTAQLWLPNPPYLVALLIHRWETPWARLFPLRLVLRLGAEFRYYPCPLVSVRNRPPLYTDIGHTIINILADFRKYSYTLPSVRGLVIHMEDRQTTINIPRNRYDQVVRALNNSNDSVLAFGANLSLAADSHLVCMQSTEDENTTYSTQAINIHNKPRRVTGASFVVFNGALKVPGLAGKSSIVEDGLMVQVPSETMTALRTALRDMRDYTVGCGPNAEETVALQWTADDTNFNIGVKSCIDGKPLDGVPSIRVHNGTDYSGGTRIIRWTEVFILQCEDSEHSSEPLDISRLSESIARATCLALVPLLDLLSAASFSSLAVRTTIHPDNVGYEAGSNGEKLPPLYMKSLDDELIAVVHQAALSSQDNPCVLELVFRIMEQG